MCGRRRQEEGPEKAWLSFWGQFSKEGEREESIASHEIGTSDHPSPILSRRAKAVVICDWKGVHPRIHF